MPNNPPGTAELIARELANALRPLETKFSSQNIRVSLATLGLRLPDTLESHPALLNAIGDVVTRITPLPDLISRLTTAVDDENLVDGILLTAEIGQVIAHVISAIEIISSELTLVAASFSDTDANHVLEFAEELPKRLLEYLIAYHLESHYPIFANVLNLTGLLEYEEIPSHPTDISKTSYIKRNLRLDNMGDLLSDPMGYFKSLYAWGDPSFNGEKLLKNIHRFFMTIGLPVVYNPVVNPGDIPSIDYLFFTLRPKLDGAEKGLEVVVKAELDGQFDVKIPFIENNWFLNLNTHANLKGGTGIRLLPGKIELIPPTGSVDGSVGFYFIAEPPSGRTSMLLLGQSGGSRITISRIKVGLKSTFNWNTTENKANGDLGLVAEFEGCKVILEAKGSDGFIGSLLKGSRVEADFSLLMGLSTSRGFYFSGSSALELRLPLHAELGPISLEGITLGLKFIDGAIPITAGADIKATLGPFVAVVQNMGVKATFSFPPDNKGNLGPAQVDFAFLPPNGLGLSLTTKAISGGGFLKLDPEKGEYFGALELSFQNVISLKAIGIINTKMPDGRDGFAMLILITAEFTPIQLGYGFTLNGVGGLLAVNRSTNLDALRQGVRTGAVSSILFPRDIVANITRIISDLKTIFPIVEGHVIIAPMAKIGWGTPTLITLELGIILDIPKPAFVIIGVLRCVLPTEEASILKLQVNFAGGIDFDEGLIWFDASLFDSSILVFTLSGDMALRIGWKKGIFVISVGGFHPAFHEVPADLTGMKRIMLSLLSGDNPRLNAQLYFAITSNTVQSGARVELYAAACGFNLYGYIGYDLLVQFSPFHFIALIEAGLALRAGTSTIAGVSVRCELSGPTPWNANGEASLTILFFEITVGFDVTWGEDAPSQPVEDANVLRLLVDALNDDRNWKAEFPANTNLTVTLKKIELPDDKIIMHPFGVLSASQKVVPLNMEINKFGNKKPIGDTKFKIEYVGEKEEVREEFAIANFQTLSDDQKLSRKSFEKMPSGIKIKANNTSYTGNKMEKEVTYEMSYIHRKKTLKIGLFKMFLNVFEVMIGGCAVSKNALSVSKRVSLIQPAEVKMIAPEYKIVSTETLEQLDASHVASTEAEAYNLQEELIRANPSLRGNIQVVSQFEI